ncbi:MAG: SpoIIE family protein phosphatase [Bacteroidota bacterium]
MISNIQSQEKHLERVLAQVKHKSDALMNYVLFGLLVIGLLLANYYDTWLIAVGVGGLSLIAYYSTKRLLPDGLLYQYVLSGVLAVFMAQYIYQMHGLFEMHFFAFIGSAILITYQEWKLQIPLAVGVVLHHALFGYLQYIGYDEIYFTQLDYMTLQTFIIHGILASIVFFICGLWAYNLKKSNVSQINQSYEIGKLQEDRRQKAALVAISEDLNESNQLLREAQSLGKAGNWSEDYAKKTVFWSEGLREIIGVDPDYTATLNAFMNMIHPEDRDKTLAEINKVRQTGNKTEFWFRLIRSNDKKERIFHSVVRLDVDSENNPLRLFGMSQDVTVLKIAEDKLEKTLLELEHRVEERTAEVKQKNKNIIDSIHYSKRIQTAMLPLHSRLQEMFPESFIFSRPKDIVSGDFFWCHQNRNKKFVIVADCTGHGVPGALMSIVCNNLLNDIIIRDHIENPAEILELLDVKLSNTITNAHGDVNDGMDISIFVVDSYFNEIHYSGAYRPLFYVNENKEIVELAGSPFPIGGARQTNKKFDTTRLPVVPGQINYLTSDGYYSQFGGPDNKKFMKKRFRELLSSLNDLPVKNQKAKLREVLHDWKGSTEQTDDVMVLGIQL